MPRLLLATALAVASAGLLVASPAAAQESGEKINQLIVYGDDPCPPPVGDEITVCARKDEAERYRIPEPLRALGSPQNDAWNNKVLAYETVGRDGINSCSPVGGGGALGCTQRLIDRAYAERGSDSSVRFGQLIQEERERRLATLDEEAAETQARVEQAEREYEARQKAAQDPQDAPPAPAPVGN